MKPTTLLCCAALLAACANTPSLTAAEIELCQDIRQTMATDLDEAASMADRMLAQNAELREPRLLRAECVLQMTKQPDRGGIPSLLGDATRDFRRALDGADDETYAAELLRMAEAHYELGRWQIGTDEAMGTFEAGSIAAGRAARGFSQKRGQQNKKHYATAKLFGARCDYNRFTILRQRELDNGEKDETGRIPAEDHTLSVANVAAAGFLEARIDYAGEAVTQTAAIHRWLGNLSEAKRAYESGIQAFPTESAIHDAYIDWMCQNGQHDALAGAYRMFVRANPDVPVLLSQQAIAIYARADRLRREGNFQGAIAIYKKAREHFGQYLAMSPQDRDNTNWWRALCDLSSARCACDSGDLEAAEELLFSAAETSDYTTAYTDGKPRMVDTFGNYFAGCVYAMITQLSQSPEDALTRTLGFSERVLQRYPDKWGFVYNAAGLAARDHGTWLVANKGDEAAAKELWERSYDYYCKAVELSPTDARIVNDCALMLIYHLHRDLDQARELCERAIQLGTEQLNELPADADQGQRQNLEEAVGDAWQNIAVLLREHRQAPFADYERFCKEAVKYYPYQRREAAALLRSKGQDGPDSTARATLQKQLSNATAGGQGSAAAALDKVLPQIDAFVEQKDYDSALTALDKLATDCKEYAPYHFQRGRINWLLGNHARDTGRRGTEFFYQDAVRALKRAVELDAEPNQPRQLLAQAMYDSGDTEGAADATSSLLLHLQSQGGGTAEENLAAHQLRANAAAITYAQKKQNGDDDKDLLTAMRTSMRWLEKQQKLDLPMLQRWSGTEAWAGAAAEAVNVYVRAAEREPDNFPVLDLVITTGYRQKQMPLVVEALKKRSDAATVWYLGKAQFWAADHIREGGDGEGAIKTLDAARKSFEQSMQKNSGYAQTCQQWIAMCIGKQGCIALNVLEDLDRAEQLLLESTRLQPGLIGNDLGLLETTKRGILGLVDKHYRANNLQKLASISVAAAEAAQGDVDLQNNAGLFARDHGVALLRAGDDKTAMEFFEKSYKAYGRAVQLDPTNVRLRNDRALIDIYHLERDWDDSKKLLEAAIRDGDKVLAENPPDNEDLKQQLEEAVGDCYENLALWHLKHSKDGKAAKEAALKSQNYHPGRGRPGARRHLRNAEQLLQGG